MLAVAMSRVLVYGDAQNSTNTLGDPLQRNRQQMIRQKVSHAEEAGFEGTPR
jgi:hypothetical protein